MNNVSSEVKADVVESVKNTATMNFVDFKAGNEYCLEVTGPCEILFKQINTWNEARKPGEPATAPDKSYILVTVSKIIGKDAVGGNVVKQVKKYIQGKNKSGYMFMMQGSGFGSRACSYYRKMLIV